MKNPVIPLLLAGGKGSRLWPLSRSDHPKQFLSFDGGPSLLQHTLERGKRIAVDAMPYIIAGAEQKKLVTASLREKESEDYRFIGEPCGRDTASAIFYGCHVLEEAYEDAVVAVLPTDHYISDTDTFSRNIADAAALAEKKHVIVLLGIEPTYPAESFGYAELGKRVRGIDGKAFHVRKFREKPSKEKAKKYIQSGDYLWNSGIFVFPLSLMREIREELFCDEDDIDPVEVFYEKMRPMAFDRFVLEKRRDVCMVPAEFDWSDLGNYHQLSALLGEDEHHNVVRGDCVLRNVSNSVIISDRKLTAVIGVKDLVIIENQGILLVCRADKTEEIRDVVNTLNESRFGYR